MAVSGDPKAVALGCGRVVVVGGVRFGFGGASSQAANASARVTISLARWRNQEDDPRD